MRDAQDDLLTRLVETLADDPAYELYGQPESTPWGAGQWIKITGADGEDRYLRVVVEPYRPG
jgi:hypothetical protein